MLVLENLASSRRMVEAIVGCFGLHSVVLFARLVTTDTVFSA